MKFNDYQNYVSSSNDFMNLKQGENKLRIVSEFETFQAEFQGKLKDRFMCYVIDRTDGQIKPFTTGASVFKQMGEHSVSSEYGFTDLPPYDVIIKKTGEGLDTEYLVTPARQDTPLTDEEKKNISELKPISEIIDAMLKKNPTKYARKDVVLPSGRVLREEDIPVIGEEDEKRPDISEIPF